MLSAKAPAKLNLSLHVCGKRADGYHLLDSLVVFTQWGDTLSVALSDTLELHQAGPFASHTGSQSDNIVLRAARALQNFANISNGASVWLDKQIPVGAGLGGGSSDAASTLQLLCRLWNVVPPQAELEALAIRLGADVPACLAATPLRMQGVGEQITPVVNLPELWVLLVNAGHSLLTADVYRAYVPHDYIPAPQMPPAPDSASLIEYLLACRNDLEPAALSLCPEIAVVLEQIVQNEGCLLARMCGSGATCFGLFTSEEVMQQAAQKMHKQKPGWWITPTRVSSNP